MDGWELPSRRRKRAIKIALNLSIKLAGAARRRRVLARYRPRRPTREQRLSIPGHCKLQVVIPCSDLQQSLGIPRPDLHTQSLRKFFASTAPGVHRYCKLELELGTWDLERRKHVAHSAGVRGRRPQAVAGRRSSTASVLLVRGVGECHRGDGALPRRHAESRATRVHLAGQEIRRRRLRNGRGTQKARRVE